MRQYQIDYRKLAVMLLPTFLRTSVLVTLVRVMIQPLQALHDKWKADCERREYNLTHTGQVCTLKAVLNDRFGLDYSNGFEIADINAAGDWVMIYDEAVNLNNNHVMAEEASHFLIFDESTITQMTHSFIVYVPQQCWAELPVIRTLVEKYRLVSRIPTYMIKP